MIAIIPELVIGMPRNTDRHRPESPHTRLVKMGLDEEGMDWHSFKRFRKTWLRGQLMLVDF
jgi:hypothetical protein